MPEARQGHQNCAKRGESIHATIDSAQSVVTFHKSPRAHDFSLTHGAGRTVIGLRRTSHGNKRSEVRLAEPVAVQIR